MLICKPKGRGNWKQIVVAVEGQRVSPLLVRAGQVLTLGGVVHENLRQRHARAFANRQARGKTWAVAIEITAAGAA